MRAQLLLAALAAAVLLGCPPPLPKDPEVAPPPAQVLEFSASASMVEAGQTVTLSWRTKDAVSVELRDAQKGAISGVDESLSSGSVDVVVGEDSLFVLDARNARGVRDSAVVSVHAVGTTPKVLFVANPDQIAAGESSVLAWTAFGAKEVSLADDQGHPLHLGSQFESGSVKISPRVSTHYVLTVDGADYPADVVVQPTLSTFEATPSWALPGKPVTLSWQTAGAMKVSLTLVGQGEIFSETDPAKVANGSFEYQVPAKIDPNAVMTFRLHAVDAQDQTFDLGTLEVYVGGSPRVTEFKVPAYVRQGGTFEVSWKTVSADLVEVLEDGVVIYRSPLNAAAVASGVIVANSPPVARTYQLRALNQRGGEARSLEMIIDSVDVPVVAPDGFTASAQPGIQNGGEPVTLTWNVRNARNLKIVAKNQYDVTKVTGIAAESGSVTVYPNADTQYDLTADNAMGDQVTVSANVTVTNPAKLTFGTAPGIAPASATIELTSHDVLGGGDVLGLPNVEKNALGEAFVDISGVLSNSYHNGVETAAIVVTLPEVFNTRLFGQAVSGNKLTVSMNGWFKFNTTAINGPNTPTPFPTNALEPLAFAPFWSDLAFPTGGTATIKTRIDSVGQDRRLIVQWTGVKHNPTAGSEITFQAQVYSSGKVVYAYGPMASMATAPVSIGVVNGTETGALVPADRPVPGDTYTFFAPATLPAPMKVVPGTQKVRVVMPQNGFIELDATYPVFAPSQFKVTEVNLSTVPGVAAQWFEVENTTPNPIELQGWTLDFGGGNTHTISTSTVLPASERIVLGQTSGAADGVPVNYAYGSNFTLAPGTPVGVTFSGSPAYASMTPPAGLLPGASWQIGPVPSPAPTGMLILSGTTSQECAASATYGTNNLRGTPGAANSTCPGLLAPSSISSVFEPISTTGTQICTLSADYSADPVTPAVPFNLMRRAVPTLYVSTNGFVSPNAFTCSGTAACYDGNKNAPSTAAPLGTIAPYWDDLISSKVYWQSRDPDATPGNGDEYTIISWEGSRRKSTATDDLNFQVKFFANGTIEYHYGTMTGDNGSGTTTWLEEPNGRVARLYNYNTNTTPGIPANSAIRFTLP